MSDLNVDGMAIAPSVVETIVSIAAKEVEGVACIGSSAVGGLRSMFASKPSTQGIEVEVGEDESLHITGRIEVDYGHVLPDLAVKVRESIADAVNGQVGASVSAIDVYIDGIQFAN